MYIVPKIEVREAEDIADFATTMDFRHESVFRRKENIVGRYSKR